MKKFLTFLLTIWLICLITVLGLTFNIKSIFVETTDTIIKKEVTNNIIDLVSEDSNVDKDKIKKEIENVLENNESIKNIINDTYDKVLDVINGKTNLKEIDLAKEVENLINDSESILNEYGLTITDEMKEEIKTVVSSEETNKFINETLTNINEEIPPVVKTTVEIYSFITGTTFKLILIILILIDLALIGLLKRSYYKWMFNLGLSLLFAGLLLEVLSPMLINFITDEVMSESNISIKTNQMSTYGIINIILGIILIVVNIILTKKVTKKENTDESNNESKTEE